MSRVEQFPLLNGPNELRSNSFNPGKTRKAEKPENLEQNWLCIQTSVENNALIEDFQLLGQLCTLFLHLEALTALSILQSQSSLTGENILDFICSNLNVRKSRVPLTATIRS